MADTGREGRFSELIRRAINDGPQTVTHRGADIAVVLSIEDYRRLTGAKRSFLDYLLSGPKLDDEFVDLINERSFLHLIPHVAALMRATASLRGHMFTGVPMKSRLPSSMPQWRRMS